MAYETLTDRAICLGCHRPIESASRAFHKEGRGHVCLECCNRIAAEKKSVAPKAPAPKALSSKIQKMKQTIANMPEAKRAFYTARQDFSPLAMATDPHWRQYLEALQERREAGIPDEF